MKRWGSSGNAVAEKYLGERRGETPFLYDIIALARLFCLLGADCSFLLDRDDATVLLHNRIFAQIVYELRSRGNLVHVKPTNTINNKKHDFSCGELRCEVKTIRTIGNMHRPEFGLSRLTLETSSKLLQSIRDDIDEATVQVGNNGIIYLSPLSMNVNAVLRNYYSDRLSEVLPAPEPGMTVLIISSNLVFNDYYIQFMTKRFVTEIEDALANIQTDGLSGSLDYYVVRSGLVLRLGPSSNGSTVLRSNPY